MAEKLKHPDRTPKFPFSIKVAGVHLDSNMNWGGYLNDVEIPFSVDKLSDRDHDILQVHTWLNSGGFKQCFMRSSYYSRGAGPIYNQQMYAIKKCMIEIKREIERQIQSGSLAVLGPDRTLQEIPILRDWSLE